MKKTASVKLAARLRGCVSAALLLSCAAAAGLYLPRALAEYEDARRQHELGVYEMDTVSLGYQAEGDIGERMEFINQGYDYRFDLEKGLSLTEADVQGVGASFVEKLRRSGILAEDIETIYNWHSPVLIGRKDGATMVLWQCNMEVKRPESDYLFGNISYSVDDATGGMLSFTIFTYGYDGETLAEQSEAARREQAERLAETLRECNGLMSADVVQEEPQQSFASYGSIYVLRFVDRAGQTYDLKLVINDRNIFFNT